MNDRPFIVERPDGFIGVEINTNDQLDYHELDTFINQLYELQRDLRKRIERPQPVMRLVLTGRWFPGIRYKRLSVDTITIRHGSAALTELIKDLRADQLEDIRPMTKSEEEEHAETIERLTEVFTK